MKRITIFFMIALLCQLSWSKDRKRSYFETHDPSPASVIVDCSIAIENGLYSISAVDTIANKTADQLYSLAKEWIGRIYNEPKAVIKSENYPTQLVFEGQLTSGLQGRLEIKFKDGRIRWLLYNIKVIVDPKIVKFVGYASKAVETVPKYSLNRGERGAKWLMADLFSFITSFRQGMMSKDDEW